MATVDEGTSAPSAPPGAAAPKHDPDMIQKLAESILNSLGQPTPTAPTPPIFRGLSPGLAVAATLNPQNRDLFIQKQMGPENAAYAQQQAQFEAAMKGRGQDMASAIGLLNAGARQTSADANLTRAQNPQPRANKRYLTTEKQPDGSFRLIERWYDPANPATPLVETDRGPAKQGVRYTVDQFGNLIQTPTSIASTPDATTAKNTGLIKPVTAGEKEQAGARIELFDQIKEYAGKLRAYSESGVQNFGEAAGQTVVRNLPLVGQDISEAYGNPEFENLAAYKAKIQKTIARMRENNRLSDQDVAFAGQELSGIASVTTPQGLQVALTKLDNLQRELTRRMARNAIANPGAFTPEERAALQTNAEADNAVTSPAPSRTVRRSRLMTLPKAEQDRAVREGWNIIEDVR